MESCYIVWISKYKYLIVWATSALKAKQIAGVA
jgi:hypothetical protein